MSEKYIVSARKYRPATFDTVVGQQALTHTLKTAIASERLAHAYLFCGPRGVGKTTCARIFAKAINCQNLSADGEPCNECESCRAFNEQRSYNIMELDAASNNTVEDIHTVIKQVQIPPQVGRYRVFIIDEVHMLSNQAFNAFLKTLEEPPEYAIFILATTEKQKIIPTILSRCQIYDFARITVPDIVAQLQRICDDKGITAEPAALNVIAQKADGAMRDALSIFDQVAASSGGDITYQAAIENLNVLDHDFYFRLDEAFLACDVPGALLIYKEIRDKGFDSQFFINGLAQHLRDLMVASTPQTANLLEMNDDIAQRHVVEAAKFAPRFYYAAMGLCNDCDLNYRNASNKQFLVELTLIKLCQLLSTEAPLTPPAPAKLKKITSNVGSNVGTGHVASGGGSVGNVGTQHVASAGANGKVGTQHVASAPAEPGNPNPNHSNARPLDYSNTRGVAGGNVGTGLVASAPAEPGDPNPDHSNARTLEYSNTRGDAAANVGTGHVASAAANGQAPAAPRRAQSPMPGRISISGRTPHASPAVAAEPSKPVQNQPFTEQQLSNAWQQYIATHPNEQLVITTMRQGSPVRLDDTTYRFTVGSAAEETVIKGVMNRLLPFLREKVANDMLAIEVDLKPMEINRHVMTDREVIEDMKQRNPQVLQLIKDFNLSLA